MTLTLAPWAQSTLNDLAEKHNQPLIRGLLKGVEKEGLRVTADGALSQTPHPERLGSALTHPHITTDFSESLLEFITPPSHISQHTLDDLCDLHNYSYTNLPDEFIWPLSMPCKLPADADIPVAQYGTSNRATMKTVYREGLGLRYGRTMQTVAGLHYNFSLPRAFWAYLHREEQSTLSLDAYITKKYFHIIRNFRRHFWLLIYLFGASPAVDASFVADRVHNLEPLADNTLGLPYATSLRMGDLGYQSSAQSSLFVCYNALPSYTSTLSAAISTPYADYQNLPNNGMRQLNSSLLQIENEFYSPIRPKRTAHAGETALTALCRRGVEYLEVRCLDLDPFSAVGISHSTIRFLDTFLLHCLFLPSPPCDQTEFNNTADNQSTVVTQGRKPGIALIGSDGEPRSLRDWGREIVDSMAPIAGMFDQASGNGNDYAKAMDIALERLDTPETTPSGRMMSAIEQGTSHIQFGLNQAKAHCDAFRLKPLQSSVYKRYQDMCEESLKLQCEEEREPQTPFEDYLKAYYQQYQDCCKETA
ncbi:MAG TPA: glutamate--cysteine ligase [Marinagarivorans sp.]